MRFNSKELSVIACQPPERFDKEGVLFIKEKQEGLFRKGEAYVERLFRLRGNLLFYFKTKDASSDVLGVIVLERCLVQLTDDDQHLYSFQIIFEGDEHFMRLATHNESDRDGWIERLHIAGYECMRIQLNSLREQLKDRTGRDPIQSGGLTVEEPAIPSAPDLSIVHKTEEPALEMCLSCRDLSCESNGQAPNTYAVIYYQAAANSSWTVHAHTEIVESNCSPIYLTTFGFNNPINAATHIKVVVYDVKERLTNTMTPVGHALFTLSSVLSAVSSSLTLRLNSLDGNDVGLLYVMAWENEDVDKLTSKEGSSTEMPIKEVPSSGRVTRMMSLASVHRRKGIALLSQDYANVFTKSFRFPVKSSNSGPFPGNDQQLLVHEYLAESRLTYTLPIQLLKLYVEEERNKIDQLEVLGALTDENDRLRQQVAGYRLSSMALYKQHIDYLNGFAGTFMKASAKKNHKEVEFVPTNLHLQRMYVCSQNNSLPSSRYDVITVGVFTASPQKYKHGGLRRMLQQFESNSVSATASNDTHFAGAAASGPNRGNHNFNLVSSVTETLSRLTDLQQEANGACDGLCSAALLGDSGALISATSRLTDQVKCLIETCEMDLVGKGIGQFSSAHVTESSQASGHTQSTSSSGRVDVSGKGSSSEFVRGQTEEPWDTTKLNTQAELMCIMSKVEELTGSLDGNSTQWLDKLSPLVIKLKRCIEVMCSRASIGLTFIAVQDYGKNVELKHMITYRRDTVFSQAITSAITGFITKIKENISNVTFLNQIARTGLLMEFESLISCHGDEMGMLEDMDIAIRDLANVQCRIEKLTSKTNSSVSISGSRYNYTVTVFIDEDMFSLLPSELSQGQLISIVPVLFSIGINEQATLADKIGDSSLQDTINRENYDRLLIYYEAFSNFAKKYDTNWQPNMDAKLKQLIRHLGVCVATKKSKNVDVLSLANEICILMNGMRFTGCKSAKDRTAMAVTLEQVRLLQSEHNLAPDFFLHALECFRSEGVRRENTYKNTGICKYAFNSIQLLYLPKLYRPPAGTYGNIET